MPEASANTTDRKSRHAILFGNFLSGSVHTGQPSFHGKTGCNRQQLSAEGIWPWLGFHIKTVPAACHPLSQSFLKISKIQHSPFCKTKDGLRENPIFRQHGGTQEQQEDLLAGKAILADVKDADGRSSKAFVQIDTETNQVMSVPGSVCCAPP
ncbi:hypothetical protein [Akkermansia sp.]|uniref:hypothetical protein n=1 Tax=Akkermansia sp. TaxID=1872421 RepID=UPI003AB81CE2